MARIVIRLDFSDGRRIGPGKVSLLEAIARSGSISAAGRALGMSYRRAWLLVEELNRIFAEPVVTTQLGGQGGGGARLTGLGERLVAGYRALEHDAQRCAADRIAGLETALAPPCPATGRDGS